MATIKAYTDLEQSKKLAKILPLKSSDMYWFEGMPHIGYSKSSQDFYNKTGYSYIACWSLATLRNLLPVGIKVNENTYLFESHNTFDKSWVYRYYNKDGDSYLYYKNTNEIDACVDMIEKLNELNLL